MNVLLVSTTDHLGHRSEELARMIASADPVSNAYSFAVKLHLLVQRSGSAPGIHDLSGFVDVTHDPQRLSLSAARNRLIERLVSDRLMSDEDVVLFPDDDCWYPPLALVQIQTAFASDPALDLWFCRYASNPVVQSGQSAPAVFRTVARFASSNTMAVRGRLLIEGLRFSEDLGVGALHNGGEDTDFALAALGRSRKAQFINAALIGHRDGAAEFSVRYYRGALLAIARNRAIPGGRRECARKIAIGVLRVCQGRMTFDHLRQSFSSLRRDHQHSRVADENCRTGA